MFWVSLRRSRYKKAIEQTSFAASSTTKLADVEWSVDVASFSDETVRASWVKPRANCKSTILTYKNIMKRFAAEKNSSTHNSCPPSVRPSYLLVYPFRAIFLPIRDNLQSPTHGLCWFLYPSEKRCRAEHGVASRWRKESRRPAAGLLPVETDKKLRAPKNTACRSQLRNK